MSGVVELKFRDGNVAEITVSGSWSLYGGMAHVKKCIASLSSKTFVKKIVVKDKGLVSWDSSLVNFLFRISEICQSKNLSIDMADIPAGAQKLVELATTFQSSGVKSLKKRRWNRLEFLRKYVLLVLASLQTSMEFFGEACMGVSAFFRRKVRIRAREFLVILQDVGVNALPIVALISFLVGLIISFISILQLAQFGASIYVANLVGISMMREMGCIMTGVIISGRTGAAFAATIGTMVVNDEIDALRTSGFSSMDFLVLPRIFALTIMMPLLCMFSSFIGIFGGMCAAIFNTNTTVTQYCTQTANAVRVADFVIGMIKSSFFGVLISSIGCLKGLECGRSAEDVGLATTSAVVTSITAIIVADSIFAVIFSAIGV
ncbi:MAG: ABC transporter permease [Puniceicoccales bacterium]|jgi:phospholipid/cholesterol/gamma-HCH transport system permease protein|nr:ABC transporter permease [Puniceicoccales bacterium]